VTHPNIDLGTGAATPQGVADIAVIDRNDAGRMGVVGIDPDVLLRQRIGLTHVDGGHPQLGAVVVDGLHRVGAEVREECVDLCGAGHRGVLPVVVASKREWGCFGDGGALLL
jgi:hypothetical protein